jgi:hypothetical protein
MDDVIGNRLQVILIFTWLCLHLGFVRDRFRHSKYRIKCIFDILWSGKERIKIKRINISISQIKLILLED